MTHARVGYVLDPVALGADPAGVVDLLGVHEEPLVPRTDVLVACRGEQNRCAGCPVDRPPHQIRIGVPDDLREPARSARPAVPEERLPQRAPNGGLPTQRALELPAAV